MKKSHKQVLQVFAIIIIVAIIYSFNKSEGFQDTGNLAAVGIVFTGPLSAIYNTFIKNVIDNTDISIPEYYKLLMTNPVLVLGPFLETYPLFTYSIIQVSTKNVIYDPIAEYAKNKTMSPFPKTTNSDTYVIYSNIFNMPITQEQLRTSEFYPNGKDGKLTNCTSQSVRANTETLISDFKALFLIAAKMNGGKTANPNIEQIGGAILFHMFDSQIAITTTLNDNSLFGYFLESEKNAAVAAGQAALTVSGYTGALPDSLTTLTPEQLATFNQALITSLKTSLSYKYSLIAGEYLDNFGKISEKIKSVADSFTVFFGFMNGITWISTVYEPCVAIKSGFQNMEGFAIDTTKLYDYKGNPIFSPAPAAAPAAAPPADNQCCTIA